MKRPLDEAGDGSAAAKKQKTNDDPVLANLAKAKMLIKMLVEGTWTTGFSGPFQALQKMTDELFPDAIKQKKAFWDQFDPLKKKPKDVKDFYEMGARDGIRAVVRLRDMINEAVFYRKLEGKPIQHGWERDIFDEGHCLIGKSDMKIVGSDGKPTAESFIQMGATKSINPKQPNSASGIRHHD